MADQDRRKDHLTSRTHQSLCGSSELRPDAVEINKSVIVVEVLSPSTAAIDHGRKLSGYFSLRKRAALSDSRSRPARRHSSQARERATRSRLVCLTGGVAQPRSAGLRGRGRSAVSAGVISLDRASQDFLRCFQMRKVELRTGTSVNPCGGVGQPLPAAHALEGALDRRSAG